MTIDARDQQTAGHSQRVTRYAEVIGRALGLEGIELEKLRAAALLHDYGKIAVRDQFLLKPGKLDDVEFEYMKVHAEKTGEFLAHLVFRRTCATFPVIAAQHHERMDGKGYPRGLPAARILLGARIVAAADVFDALTAPRYYKPAYNPREDARDHGRHGRRPSRPDGRRGRTPRGARSGMDARLDEAHLAEARRRGDVQIAGDGTLGARPGNELVKVRFWGTRGPSRPRDR